MSNTQIPAIATPSRAARFIAFPVVRIVLGIVAVVVPVVLTLGLARTLLDKSMRVMWPQLLATVLCVICYGYYVRLVEKRPVSELSRAGAWREAGAGVAGAAAVLAATMGILFVCGIYQVTGSNRWTVMIVPMAELVLVAFVEELIFRGVLFRIVENALGTWIALAITACLFALAHLPNEGVTVLAVAVTAMAGVMLGAAYMATRRLWLAIGIHFGWNFMLSSVFSVTVSGHPSTGLLQGALVGPDWLTGGAYGLEASVVGLVVVSLAGGMLIALAQQRGHVMRPYWKHKVDTDLGVRTV